MEITSTKPFRHRMFRKHPMSAKLYGRLAGRSYEAQGKGSNRKEQGAKNYLPPTRYYNPKTDFVSQTEFILVRHRMSARHPMSEIPLFDEMHLEQTAFALQKDIGCFANIRCLESNCMGDWPDSYTE